MTKFYLLLLVILIGCESPSSIESEPLSIIDRDLRERISRTNLVANNSVEIEDEEYILGRSLFNDTLFSSNNTISCQNCHQMASSSDNLPLSKGFGDKILARNSQQLFNISNNNFAFHDGRVSFTNGTLTIPESLDKNITDEFESSLEAQILFPILNRNEMRGPIGHNSLADITDNSEYLYALMTNKILPKYQDDLQRVYPTQDITNPALVSKAIAKFIKVEFNVANTPYDQYLNGNNEALSLSQKRGFITFLGRGQCINCHNGINLSDDSFHSVGVPQIFPNLSSATDDLGRAGVTGISADAYKFKTPGLRNIKLSPPYMHNGVFQNLDQVIEHYNNIERSINSYRVTSSEQQFYETQILVDTSVSRNRLRFDQIDEEPLKRGLRLSSEQREDLVNFLEALSDR